MGESILCDIEQGISDQVWRGLLNEDENLIKNEQTRTNLYGYMVAQIWRVPTKKKILNEAIDKINDKCNADLSADRLFAYFIYCQTIVEATNMSYNNKHKLIYLHTKNGVEFITSDNPIINLCTQFDEHGAPITYELFWPLTSQLALLLTENKQEITRVVENSEV